ncbi:hypothetical protein UCRPC4_g03562 [Phaeomoniella chlamydospora]|uniref:Uncharacterized protein n=1 Tax=Phaeomoniella chlamydospora TaxID=158046 RepID=A0A0G2EHB4_PHACM|nr:hypothetical protein UCRPC4_g03562 [Phaeomoniella chlamydospora]
MSDTRQAHPEYAADVDEMILDYLIYQTTSSFLKAFRKKEIENDRHHADGYAIHLNLLDSFIKIYKDKYGEIESRSLCSENLDLKIRMLQFTLTIASPFWRNTPYATHLTDSGILLAADRDDESREDDNLSPRTTEQLVEIYRSIDFPCLLPEFLYLSAVASQILNQDPSEQWMEMAAEFMMHAAFSETLTTALTDSECPRNLTDPSWDRKPSGFRHFTWRYFKDSENNNVHQPQLPHTIPSSLKDQAYTHAHHHLRRMHATNKQYPLTLSELNTINQMFRSGTQDTDSNPPLEEELQSWSQIRLRTLSQFESFSTESLTLSSSPTPTQQPPFPIPPPTLKTLHKQYPFSKFLPRILSFCEHQMLTNNPAAAAGGNTNDNDPAAPPPVSGYLGVPVLVAIEKAKDADADADGRKRKGILEELGLGIDGDEEEEGGIERLLERCGIR